MDMDDISRDVTQRLAQLTSTAINITQQIQHRRAASARQEAAEQMQRRDEIADQLRAGHSTQAARWEQLRAHPNQPLSDQELATQWVSAATWEHQDVRAERARRILDERLTASGIPQEQLDQQRSETQAAEILTEQRQPVVIDNDGRAWNSDDRELWTLVTSGPDPEGGIEWHELAERIDTEATSKLHKALGMAMTEAATDRDGHGAQPQDTTGPHEPLAEPRQSANAGNVYVNGAEPARLAGQSYPESASAALAKTGKKAIPRTTRPSKQRDHDRSR